SLDRTMLCNAAFAASGVLAGLAVLGRQVYLPLVFPYLAVAAANRRLRPAAILALACLGAVVAPVFFIWGGILAPTKLYHGGSIVISHGVLSVAYLGAAVLIVAPAFYRQAFWPVIAIATAAAVVNGWLIGLEQLPLQGMLGAFEHARGLAARIGGSVMVGLACAFAVAFALTVWRNRHDFWLSVIAVVAFSLAATPFGIIHAFSSRYTFAACPFTLLLLRPFFTPSLWASARLLLGAALGAVSLYTYYWPSV